MFGAARVQFRLCTFRKFLWNTSRQMTDKELDYTKARIVKNYVPWF